MIKIGRKGMKEVVAESMENLGEERYSSIYHPQISNFRRMKDGIDRPVGAEIDIKKSSLS